MQLGDARSTGCGRGCVCVRACCCRWLAVAEWMGSPTSKCILIFARQARTRSALLGFHNFFHHAVNIALCNMITAHDALPHHLRVAHGSNDPYSRAPYHTGINTLPENNISFPCVPEFGPSQLWGSWVQGKSTLYQQPLPACGRLHDFNMGAPPR